MRPAHWPGSQEFKTAKQRDRKRSLYRGDVCLRGAPKLKEAVDSRSDDEHTTHCFQYRRLIKSTSQSTTHADVSELVSNEEIENENENEKLGNATREDAIEAGDTSTACSSLNQERS